MDTTNIFSVALGINAPWFISDVRFDCKNLNVRQLDINLHILKQ